MLQVRVVVVRFPRCSHVNCALVPIQEERVDEVIAFVIFCPPPEEKALTVAVSKAQYVL